MTRGRYRSLQSCISSEHEDRGGKWRMKAFFLMHMTLGDLAFMNKDYLMLCHCGVIAAEMCFNISVQGWRSHWEAACVSQTHMQVIQWPLWQHSSPKAPGSNIEKYGLMPGSENNEYIFHTHNIYNKTQRPGCFSKDNQWKRVRAGQGNVEVKLSVLLYFLMFT